MLPGGAGHGADRDDAAVLDDDADAFAPGALLHVQQAPAIDCLGGGVRAVQGQQDAGGHHGFHRSSLVIFMKKKALHRWKAFGVRQCPPRLAQR
jgi:hypothetical protein